MKKYTDGSASCALVASGSGGHIVPLLTLAEQWLHQNPHGRILLFCTSAQMDSTILAAHASALPIICVKLPLSALKKITWWRYPLCLTQLAISLLISLWWLVRYRPQEVVSTGGYSAIPVMGAAWLLRIRRVMYQLDAVVGRATAFLAPLLSQVCITFASSRSWWEQQAAYQRNTLTITLVPYPVRFDEKPNQVDYEKAWDSFCTQVQKRDEETHNAMRKAISITDDGTVASAITHVREQIACERKPVLLVLGGSQGSQWINSLIMDWVRACKWTRDIAVVHQAGNNDLETLRAAYVHAGVQAHIFSYDNDMFRWYTLADSIVSRAGAGTLFEILFFHRRAFVIPLRSRTTQHQVDNARAMATSYPHLFTICEENPDRAFMVALLDAYARQHLGRRRDAQVPENRRGDVCERV